MDKKKIKITIDCEDESIKNTIAVEIWASLFCLDLNPSLLGGAEIVRQERDASKNERRAKALKDQIQIVIDTTTPKLESSIDTDSIIREAVKIAHERMDRHQLMLGEQERRIEKLERETRYMGLI